MVKIIICDNNLWDRQNLRTLISDYCTVRDISFTIRCFRSAECLLRSDLNHCDILFMNTCMPKISGIEAVRRLRPSYSFPIVFTSYRPDYAVTAFSLGAIHYLLKPVCAEHVTQALTRCMEQISSKNQQSIFIKSSYKTIAVSVDSILYIEVFNNCSVIHTETETLRTYQSLDSLYHLLDPEKFMRPHRSYIVPMKMIKEFNLDHILLKNGIEIVLSRRRRHSLKQQYQDYMLRLISSHTSSRHSSNT